MTDIFKTKATLVWMLLFVATGGSWLLGGRAGLTEPSGPMPMVTILFIAIVKIRLVLIHFMELGHAPIVWRVIFEAWVAVVGGGMILIYLLG